MSGEDLKESEHVDQKESVFQQISGIWRSPDQVREADKKALQVYVSALPRSRFQEKIEKIISSNREVLEAQKDLMKAVDFQINKSKLDEYNTALQMAIMLKTERFIVDIYDDTQKKVSWFSDYWYEKTFHKQLAASNQI